jgi:membrane protease YdiL (CAAX protease family)
MTYKAYNQIHPAIQFLLFISIFIIVFIIGNIVGPGIVWALYGLKTLTALAGLNVSTPHFLPAIWILQLLGMTLPIFAAPVFFAFIIVKDPDDYIKPSFHFPWILIFLVLAIMFISNPLIEFLSNLNQKMVLPDYLKWMRDKEDEAQKITEAMLQMKTIWDLILDVLLIGLLTAIAEEFMFRGCFQTIFFRWTGNIHIAVWITAILFSAFHMEFFGFLPRLVLGVLFGYFVAWSGSIWTSVWAHFINNGAAVVAAYLFQHKLIKTNPDDQHLFSYLGYVLSLIIILLLLFTYRRATFNKEQIRQS